MIDLENPMLHDAHKAREWLAWCAEPPAGGSTIADLRTPKTLKWKARGFLHWRKRDGR
jgi:hypothetical protein